MSETTSAAVNRGRSGAMLVTLGILFSKSSGILREMIKARYLGATGGPAADAFTAAIRIPNLLQNLLGDQALSAAFVPVYARLRAEGRDEEASRVATTIGALLALVSAIVVLLGVTFAGPIVDLINHGFLDDPTPERRNLTVQLTRIMFPAGGLFVISAWCLGILNSHRHLFLGYAAPVLWNLAIIGGMYWSRGQDLPDVARAAAWGSVIGAGLQVAIQLPTLLRYVRLAGKRVREAGDGVRRVLRSFGPVALSRSGAQLSAFIDQSIASILPLGMPTVLAYGQTLYMLPISLFGIGMSASTLTEMARTVGSDEEVRISLRERLQDAAGHVAFFVVPCAVAMVVLGDVIVAALFQSGEFNDTDTFWTWTVLWGGAVGLLAATISRLYQTTFYALEDSRTPARIAMGRLVLSTAAGYFLAVRVPGLLGVDARWGAAGLPLASGLAAWIELSVLRRLLHTRIGPVKLPGRLLAKLWTVAAVAGAAGFGVKTLVGVDQDRRLLAALVFGSFGVVYLAGSALAGVTEARSMLRRVRLLRG